MTPSQSARKTISIVTPVFMEEDNVQRCYEEIKRLFEQELPDYQREHVFADNGSSDSTVAKLREIAANDPCVKVIVNSRNFGALQSIFNATLATTGDAVVPCVAADLQDPPEVIPEFVKLWEQGHMVVNGIRANRSENPVMLATRRLYYRLVRRLANVNVPLNAGEFQLLDRKVVESLRQFEDYYPYVRGMVASCGFNPASVSYEMRPRLKGRSRLNLYTLIDIGLNGIISLTNVPIRLCMFVGFMVAMLSFGISMIGLFRTLAAYWEGDSLADAGIPTLIIGMFFLGGVQLFFLGLVGEYISAIHSQVRKRPLVVEAERINFQSTSQSCSGSLTSDAESQTSNWQREAA
ncbi:glycosyltransferase [bacterium]|nr:glycosyltransferase [bacterium]